MHQLFTIEHLVQEICSYVSEAELPALARVSSVWFRCVMRLYAYPDISQVLAPLGEMILKPDIVQFVNPPSNKDLKRFPEYFSHVRTLFMEPASVSIVLEVMRKSVSRDIPYLFPHLREVEWDYPEYSPECMEVSLGLISPKIDILWLNVKDGRMLHYLCPLVMSRLTTLHSISINHEVQTGTAGNSTEPSFVKPVQDLLTFFTPALEFVHISLSLNTPSVIECLSKMPNLCNLTIGAFSGKELEPRGRCENTGSFPSLRSLSFDGSSQSFHDMLTKPYDFASLTTLSLNVQLTPTDVPLVVSSIVSACPRIETLVLGKVNTDALTNWPVVPWSVVQPTSYCKELTKLSLNGMCIAANMEELTKFLKSRTTWAHLYVITSVPLRLQDIVLYAKYCPDLKHLGICVNVPDGISVKDLPLDLPQFSTLTSIDFTGSNITESTSDVLARLLYRICKKPPYQLKGLDEKVTDRVLRSLAIAYLDEQCRVGGPMSREVAEFVRKMVAIPA